MKICTLPVILLTAVMCCCHSPAPATAVAPLPVEPIAPVEELTEPELADGVAIQVPMTLEETEDLQKLLGPLCETQEEITVHYHGIQYKGDKPKSIPLGTLSAADFQALASTTQSVATGEVIDDFELYSFRSKNGKKVEAYISQSNREYGIELKGAPAVYAPEFHDRVLAMRNSLVQHEQESSTTKDAQH